MFLDATAAASAIGFINMIGNLGGFVGPYVVGKSATEHAAFADALFKRLPSRSSPPSPCWPSASTAVTNHGRVGPASASDAADHGPTTDIRGPARWWATAAGGPALACASLGPPYGSLRRWAHPTARPGPPTAALPLFLPRLAPE